MLLTCLCMSWGPLCYEFKGWVCIFIDLRAYIILHRRVTLVLISSISKFVVDQNQFTLSTDNCGENLNNVQAFFFT